MVKGFLVGDGYVGYIEKENRYQKFETEGEYLTYIKEEETNEKEFE